MFHLELRQFPHQTRAFNLTGTELRSRVLDEWVAGRPVELDDRRWAPDRAKLTIYEARELAHEEIGLGRGWSTVTREGENVTERLLATARQPPDLGELKQRLLDCERPVSLKDVVALDPEPGRRVSERLGLAEQAVWELLHEQRLRLVQDGDVVPPERWQAVLLSWESWAYEGDVLVHAVSE